ncbi:MAG: M23 family metallopeptidase [Oscillospiraceae bacterium]|nr:M23 family metallopeptidase [Oscillospiraceae bacterium]
MKAKNPMMRKLEAFFAGKGFYIVMLLCLSVIGFSAWTMLSARNGADTGNDVSAVSGLLPEAVLPVNGADAAPAVTEKPAAAMPPETAAPALNEPEQPAAEAAAEPPQETLPAVVEVRHYFVWPVNGEVERPWAMETLSYDPTMHDWRTHDGLDIAASVGSTVVSAGDGRVTAVYEDERWGTVVEIAHANGLTGFYANLAATPTVSAGQTVNVGQVIGSVGATALCEIGEAAHLHFALYRDGVSVDPNEVIGQ